MFISMLGMGIVNPFLPIYANTMGASNLEVGFIQAAFSITGIGTLVFIGRLSDRFGRKSFLSGGLTVLAVSSVGLMYAYDPLHLILWRFVFKGNLVAGLFNAISGFTTSQSMSSAFCKQRLSM